MRIAGAVLATVLLCVGLCAAAEFKSDEAKNAVTDYEAALNAAKFKYGQDLAAAKAALDEKKAAADNAIVREAFEKESELMTQELVRLQEELKGGAAAEPKEFKTDAARKAATDYAAAMKAAKTRYGQNLLAAQKAVLAKKGASAEAIVKGAYQQELDLIAEEVKQLREGVEGAKPKAGPPDPSAKSKPGPKDTAKEKAGKHKEPKWLDVLAFVDPAKDKIEGTWRRTDAGISLEDGPTGFLAIPVAPKGNYEFCVKFTRTSGNDTLIIVLPAGPKAVAVLISFWGGLVSGLGNIKGKDPKDKDNETGVRPGGIANNVEHTVYAKVIAGPKLAEITVTLDSKPLVNWKGPTNDLSPWYPTGGCLVLGISNSKIIWHSAELRMLSGDAKPMRPLAKPAPSAK